MTAVRHLSDTAERHPALLNLALAALGLGVFAGLYWFVSHVGGLPR